MTILQVLMVCATYGQTDQDDTTILRKAFREVTSLRQIVYVDTVNSNRVVPDRLKEIIYKDMITDKQSGNSLKLKKDEQDYLFSQLSLRTIWTDNIFTDSKLINSDSMWTYLSQENKKRIVDMNQAVLSKDTLTLKKLQYYYSYVFAFTKPIYIRDNTICLISFAGMCGIECGREETSFYKKENNEWTKWIIVSAGDF